VKSIINVYAHAVRMAITQDYWKKQQKLDSEWRAQFA